MSILRAASVAAAGGAAAAALIYGAAGPRCRLNAAPGDTEDKRFVRTASLLRRSSLHSLNPDLQKVGLAEDPREATPFRGKPKQTAVVRIALTGGPCAGKSSCLAYITETATAAGFDVYRSPEVATLLFNAGCQLPLGDPEGMFRFQSSLVRLQLAVERNLTTIAASTGRPSIIIFDRGCLDAKGYMDPPTWARVLGEADSTSSDTGTVKKGVTESYLLNRCERSQNVHPAPLPPCPTLRYRPISSNLVQSRPSDDGVLHLVTAADGAPEYYKYGKVKDDLGNTVIRHETPEQAVALDVQTRTPQMASDASDGLL
jgi:hypothetical protein